MKWNKRILTSNRVIKKVNLPDIFLMFCLIGKKINQKKAIFDLEKK